MKKELNIFQWTDEDTEGFDDMGIGVTGDYEEIDLADEEAKKLVTYIQSALSEGNHISFRVADEDPEREERELAMDNKRELAFSIYGDPDLWEEV